MLKEDIQTIIEGHELQGRTHLVRRRLLKMTTPKEKQLELKKGGKSIWVRIDPGEKWVRFTMLGPRLGILATEFVSPNRLREIGRELIRLANDVQGKTGLRSVKG